MKILKILLTLFMIFQLSIFSSISSFAELNNSGNLSTTSVSAIDREVTRGESFSYIAKYLLFNIPTSYKYISLKYTDVKTGTKLYENVQKLVYMDLIPNREIKVEPSKNISVYNFYKMVEGAIGIELIDEKNSYLLKNRNTTVNDFLFVNNFLAKISEIGNQSSLAVSVNYTQEENDKFRILFDVYQTILQDHYDNESIDKQQIIYGAIQGLADATGDKYTTFFPPIESKDFIDSLAGEFEGIGAYVEMQKPGELTIVSPISGSPSEKAGLKGGDKIIKVDGKEIDKNLDSNGAVALIKGPAGTKVTLTILRDSSTFDIEVERAKISIHDVEYKIINNDTFYIEIRMFGDKVFDEFRDALTVLSQSSAIQKVVIDLRNNPGGYLEQVTSMLSLFIEKGQPTAVVKTPTGETPYYSSGYNLIDLSNYKLYVLGNSGTASASEIMIGTMKDYFPDLEFVGEKTFGKGSVQTIRGYNDGSSFKYTTAKWYTGKTRTGIDGIGISPDTEIKLDTNASEDLQLKYILDK